MARRQTVALAMLGRRYADFDVLMQWIHVLRGTWWPGPTFTHRDLYPGEGRNVLTAGGLLDKSWSDWLWVDSDHLPSPKFIARLEEYPEEVELVIGCYFNREYPFDLQAWDDNLDPDSEGLLPIHPARIDEMLAKPGLYRVGGGGTGWMFIRRRVLERMTQLRGRGAVWEIKGYSPEMREKLGLGIVMGEDVHFCVNARQLLGVQAWLDTDPRARSGHMQTRPVDARDWQAAHMMPVVLDKATVEAALAQNGHVLEIDPGRKRAPIAQGAPGTRKRRRLLERLRRR